MYSTLVPDSGTCSQSLEQGSYYSVCAGSASPKTRDKAQELCLSMIYAPALRRRRMTCVKGISQHAKTGRRVDCATTSGRAYAAEQHKGVRACVPFSLSAAVIGDAARGRMYTRSRLWSAACPALHILSSLSTGIFLASNDHSASAVRK